MTEFLNFYKLRAKVLFPDWVITTAFYTALHFVRYKVFPITMI